MSDLQSSATPSQLRDFRSQATQHRNNIARLSEQLINQIAAGEVVERPASALKECLENSLDAGSRNIHVFLEGGGTRSIRITDDGHGMAPEDLLLCIERHATSKLSSLEDLQSMSTFGFRGEALSSIAAVSELEICSRTAAMAHAYRLRVNYGTAATELEPVGMQVGTSVSIENLFGRIPARQKYLRSEPTELSHCVRVVKELALGNPQCRFLLHHGGHRIAHFFANSRLERLKECLSVRWQPVHLLERTEDLKLEAFLSPPDATQGRNELFLFINGRGVRHRTLLAAVRNAYAESVGEGSEPSGTLYLDIRPDWVDVNVHPQKLEVRLLRQEALYPWLLAAIRKTFGELTGREEKTEQTSPPPQAISVSAQGQEKLRFIATLKNNYLLYESEDSIVVVNPFRQKRYEAMARLESHGFPPHPLAKPLTLDLSPESMRQCSACSTLLSKLGFEVVHFGGTTLQIRAIPPGVSPSQASGLISTLFRELRNVPESEWPEAAITTLLRAREENEMTSSPELTGPLCKEASFSITFDLLEEKLGRTKA